MKTDFEVIQSGREAWLEHEYTKAQRMKTAAAMARSLKLLLNVCADSADANVVRAYGTYRLQERIHAFVGGEGDENGTR